MQSSFVTAKSLRLTLHPITPIHVWSGRKLLAGLDVISKDLETLCIVDVDRLPPVVVEEFLRIPVENIAKAIEKHIARIPCKQELKTTTTLPPSAQLLELNSYIVPGSTLKGYIRTSIIFHLINSLGSRDRIASILRSGIDLTQKPNKVSEGLEAYFFRAPKPPRQRGFVDSFQALLVSDPELAVDQKCYSVSELQVHEFASKGLKHIASQYAVTVSCGELRYRIDIRAPQSAILSAIVGAMHVHKDDVEKMRLLESISITKALKEFGCYVLSKELKKVEIYKELDSYAKILSSFYAKYCEKELNCVVARIGYMTGHVAKTVLSIVRSVDPQLYQDIKAFMESHFRHAWDELTIKLVKTSQGLVGPGWCELCLE